MIKNINYLGLILLFMRISTLSFAQTGHIKGIVIDADNNEAVPYANILVVNTTIGTSSSFDGKFTLDNLEAGYLKLQISSIGYKSRIVDDIFVTNSNSPYLEIKLQSSENILEEVVVKVNPFQKKEESPLSMQSITTREIESNPGSNRDISRVIQSFPGVGSTPAFRNDVIIRGGGPSENRFFLDGIEIPVLNHFSTQGASGGPVGIINADFVRAADFYSASFPASKYNALSGILDFRLKEGSKDKTNLQLTVGASETALTLDGPIGEKTTYIFSVRRSYLQYLFSAIGLPFLPTYNDYQLKIKTNFNTKNQLSVISIGSLDNMSINNEIKNPSAAQEYIASQIPVNNQWSYTFGLVYKHFFKNGSSSFILSRNMLNNEFYKFPDNNEDLPKSLDYTSREIENKFRYELDFNSKGIKYSLSANVEFAKYSNQTTQQVYTNGSLSGFQYNTDIDLAKYGLSAQATKRFFDELMLVSIGMRMDANNYNANTKNLFNQFSPRLSASLALSEKTALNAGIGRYFQQAAYTTLGFSNNANELVNQDGASFIGLNQYNLGLEHRFSDKILLSVEGFYKDYFQYPVDLVSGSSLANQGATYSSVYGASEVAFNGKGKASGFEILNRWNYKTFSILASYTYVRSLFTDIQNNYIPSSWDSKHLLTITTSKDLKRNWQLGFKWRYVGGLPYTPYDLETSSNIQAWDAIGQPYLDYSQLNSKRFSAFHQLDLRIDKNYFFNKWTLMLYFDIQNAYNFKNKGQDFIIREKDMDGNYLTMNDGKQYILQSVENLSGTVLPSIGIMLKF